MFFLDDDLNYDTLLYMVSERADIVLRFEELLKIGNLHNL